MVLGEVDLTLAHKVDPISKFYLTPYITVSDSVVRCLSMLLRVRKRGGFVKFCKISSCMSCQRKSIFYAFS